MWYSHITLSNISDVTIVLQTPSTHIRVSCTLAPNTVPSAAAQITPSIPHTNPKYPRTNPKYPCTNAKCSCTNPGAQTQAPSVSSTNDKCYKQIPSCLCTILHYPQAQYHVMLFEPPLSQVQFHVMLFEPPLP